MNDPSAPKPNMLGPYGGWAAGVQERSEQTLSFLQPGWGSLPEWKRQARERTRELMRVVPPGAPASPGAPQGRRGAAPAPPEVAVRARRTYDGLSIEELAWELPWGPPVEAVFLKPAGASGPLPGVLGLHDHGAVKYFGKRKITRTADPIHPFIREHQATYYGGAAWANELARRGYGVLVHDVFGFASRRIRASGLPGYVVRRMLARPEDLEELRPEDLTSGEIVTDYEVGPEEPLEQIRAYHAFAARHEDIIAKSLFCAGLTWPGVFVAEDLHALEVLRARPEIDPERLGCCGLSGGGLRTNYLAGLDDRIRCSVTVGFMTTWRDFLLNTCHTHTWMIYIPLLPSLMEYPEILSMRAPLPSLVLATREDPLFTLEEVRRAAGMLERVYEKAGAPERFHFSLYPGPHKFDLPMQEEAFAWLDRWLRQGGSR